LYGHSIEEIAAKLGIGLEAAQSLLARAKRSFQEVYAGLTNDFASGRNEERLTGRRSAPVFESRRSDAPR
jgi:hypothetical protein